MKYEAKSKSHEAKAPHERPHHGVRKVNAVLAAFLVCFFLVHAFLGSFDSISPIPHRLEPLVWGGVGILAVHVVLCGITTYYMYTDKERPPSDRKKRHQVLKWVTGGVLLALAIFHMAADGGAAASISLVSLIVLLALVTAIANHSYTGAKSLSRDLDLPKRVRTPIRIGMIAGAVIVGILAIAAFALHAV